MNQHLFQGQLANDYNMYRINTIHSKYSAVAHLLLFIGVGDGIYTRVVYIYIHIIVHIRVEYGWILYKYGKCIFMS